MARLLSPTFAAEYLGGIHRTTLYRLAKSGKIAFTRVGAHIKFPVDALDAYIESNAVIPNSTKQRARAR